jgi:hypothetical protein
MTGKETTGKLKLSLVPPEILTAVASIREYGCKKYNNPENWKGVPPQEFWDAAIRHTKAAWEDWTATDEESGMPHIWHIACNISFLCQMLAVTESEPVQQPAPLKEEPKKKIGGGNKKKPSKRAKIDVQKVLELRKQGDGNQAIAERLGVKAQSISSAISLYKKSNPETKTEEELPS